jgi:hypothetical protein
MALIVKIEKVLVEGSKKTRLGPVTRRQITKAGSDITAGDVKTLASEDLFDPLVYSKDNDEVWGSDLSAPLTDDTVVSKRANITYRLYLSKK